MDRLNRLRYAIKIVERKSVVVMKRAEWENYIWENGEITLVPEIPEPMKGLRKKAADLVVVASGYCNPDPGMDVFRKDEKDYPHIINAEHYTAVQTLCAHPAYKQILDKAGIEESQELNSYLKENIFLVGPEERGGEHWLKELPDHIKNAKLKIKWFNKI